MAKTKAERLLAIRELVTEQLITSQDQLLKELAVRGYKLTQATLSRDIKELQIAKVPTGKGHYQYRISPNAISKQHIEPIQIVGTDVSRSWTISLEFSGQIAVLKTKPGYASVVADIVDKSQNDGIMGTLAGDDTVLLILRANSEKASIVRALSLWLPDIESRII